MPIRLIARAALGAAAAVGAIDPCSAQEPGGLPGRFGSGRFEAVFESSGRYRFSLAGDTLRFTLISDDCQGRRNALAQAWIRDRAAEFALTNITVIDGTGAPPRPGMTVLVREGTIVGLFPTGSEAVPATAAVSDLSGRFVIPGLIDSHVHLATDPSTGDRRALVEQRLRHALHGGITAVRDMAGDGRALADLARAALVGDIESPAISYSALMSGPSFFEDPRVRSSSRGVTVGSAPWARAVTAESDWPLAVAEARGTGATGIKLYAELPGELLPAITAEAHRQGMKVWSHATLVPARPSQAVAGGVDALSHAGLLLWEVAPLPDFRRRSASRPRWCAVRMPLGSRSSWAPMQSALPAMARCPTCTTSWSCW